MQISMLAYNDSFVFTNVQQWDLKEVAAAVGLNESCIYGAAGGPIGEMRGNSEVLIR